MTDTQVKRDPTESFKMRYEELFTRVESVLGVRETRLIEVAQASLCTQLDNEALLDSLARARDAGITREEISEALDVVAMVGLGSPIQAGIMLKPLLETRGMLDPAVAASEAGQRARERTLANAENRFSPPPYAFETLLEMDPGLSEDLMKVFECAHIDRRLFILLCVSCNGAPSHMHEEGLAYRMGVALDFGVTPSEILAVLTLSAAVGYRTLKYGHAGLDKVFGF